MSENPTRSQGVVVPKINVVPQPPNTVKKRRRQRPSVPRPASPTDSSDEENLLEKSIRLKAARNCLTQHNIRDIIKNVVQNELVLDAVHKRADAMDKQVEDELERTKDQLLDTSSTVVTRRLAKERNQPPLKIQDLNYVPPDKNLIKLVGSNVTNADHSSDSGSDFEPNCDEETDDYSTATCSDIESQPRTPCDVNFQSEVEDQPALSQEIVYDDHEGVFKLPQGLPLAKTVEKICKRTRSKMSLKSVEIETLQQPILESTSEFNESDFDWDGDDAWAEFMTDLQRPLTTTQEDGEETDPEFVCNEATLNTTTDSDWSMVVPRRELDSLLNEILDDVKECVNRSLEQELAQEFQNTIPVPENPLAITENVNEKEIEAEEDDSTSTSADETKEEQPPKFMEPAEGVDALNIIVPTPIMSQFSLVQGSDNNMYLIPVNQSVSHPQPPKPKSAFLEINVNDDILSIISQINAQRLVHYEETVRSSLVINGWTQKALKQFQWQLLAHVQLMGQLFTLTYSHPTFWRAALPQWKLLEKLSVQADHSPILRDLCWNLKDMLGVCQQWKSELDEITDENQAYMKILEGETERKLTKRYMDMILNNKAFLFPEILPYAAPAVEHTGYIPSKALLFLLYLKHRGAKSRTERRTHRLIRKFRIRFRQSNTLQSYQMMMANNKMFQRYFEKGEVPEINPLQLEYESYEDVVPLRNVDVNRFYKEQWKTYLKELKLNKEKEQKEHDLEGEMEREKSITTKKEVEEQKPAKVTVDFQNFKVQYEMPQYYGVGDAVPDEENTWLNVETAAKPKTVKMPKNHLTQVIKDVLNKQSRKKVNKTKEQNRKYLTQKLHCLVSDFDWAYDVNMQQIDANSIATKLFYYFKEFDIFLRLLHARINAGPLGFSKLPPLPNIIDLDLLKVEAEEDPEPLPSQPNLSNLVEGKNKHFAWKFMDHLKRELKSDNLKYFQDVLKRFNAKKDSAVEFYLLLEEMLVTDFKEVIQIFLVYLLPGYIAQIGEFVEAAIRENVEEFQSNLNLYIRQREMQLELIYEYLNSLMDRNAGALDVQQSLLSSLAGNPLITDWFMLLFPPDCQEMCFWRNCRRIQLPITLYDIIKQEEVQLRGLPPMNLRISDSENEDDVECTGVEELKSPEYTTYSVPSEEESGNLKDLSSEMDTSRF